ncbi:MAG TPA: response regulator [Flavisolibacter sp.]|jgi:CheY-like chemotaxis protein|nr:response regulator [Flavisolibacter sp.]
MHAKGPIIVIEDDQDDQEILKDVMQDLGIKDELRFFDDCERAFDYLVSTPDKPFLIICDINLPRMNGIELKQRIDATNHLRQMAVPFIFLTTSDNQKTVNDAYRTTHIQGYFTKQPMLDEIKRKLKLILNYWTEALHPV